MPIAYIHMHLCISTDCILGGRKKKKRERYKTKKEKRHKEIRGVKNMDCPVKSN